LPYAPQSAATATGHTRLPAWVQCV